MRPVILYSVASLDLFIARPDGDVNGLFTDQEYGYPSLYEKVIR